MRVLEPVSALVKESFGIDSSAYIAYYDSMLKGVKSGDRQSWISIFEMQRASTSTRWGLRFLYTTKTRIIHNGVC